MNNYLEKKQISDSNSNNEFILVLDDNHDIVTLIKDALQIQGFKVSAFTDPLTAIEYFKTNCKDCRLAISDIRVPKMNGYEFVKKVKEIKPKVKVFFLTAFEIDETEIKRVLSSILIDEFIQKPVSLKNLINLINKYNINNNNNYDPNYELNTQITSHSDMPAGLKKLLTNHGITIEHLKNMESSDISNGLGIDHNIARLIVDSEMLMIA